jgi:hypothetical protein
MADQSGAYKVALVAGTTTDGGDVLSLLNPEGVDLLITRFVLHVTTDATGEANIDAGVAADGTTSSDTLIDGLAIAAGVFDNIDDQGNNGAATVAWDSDEYITVTPDATCAGLVGYAYIEYIRV